MRKPKSTSKPDDSAGAAAAEPARKKSLAIPAAAALAAAGAAGAASFYFLPESVLPASAKTEPSAAAASHAPPGAKENHAKKEGGHEKAKKDKGKSKGEDEDKSPSDAQTSMFYVRGEIGVFVLRPIVVTLMPQGRVRYLKVSLAIETSPDAEDAFIGNELRLIDVLNGYLRAVPVSAIEDPAAMARIREQVARRIRFVMDESPVDAVLITDFILT